MIKQRSFNGSPRCPSRSTSFIPFLLLLLLLLSLLLSKGPPGYHFSGVRMCQTPTTRTNSKFRSGSTIIGDLFYLFKWEGEDGGGGCCLLVAERPSNMLAYLRDGSAQKMARAATLRKKLQTKLSTSPSHSILTPGRQVPALTLQRQAPGRVATGVPILKSLV